MTPGGRLGSLARAGLAARLAPWLDQFDRHRRFVGGAGWRLDLGRLLLGLALLLVARSISALAHWSRTSDPTSVEVVPASPIEPYRSVTGWPGTCPAPS